ncbi:MAG: NAD(P)-dependent oxidoreductase [Acidobacteria bacterium]|nr:NAD(P)-dependent oxidoreductase [Acidobacteriota bacterium]
MKIGVIGLGIMGAPMAAHLIQAGHQLTVCDRAPRRIEGATVASTPADAARASEVLITMLPDTPDVEQVLFGTAGAAETLQPGAVAIDMSTISPQATTGFAARLAAQGVTMLDAPVSGGEPGARNATLSIMAGGDRAAFDQCLPIFQKLGRNIVYAGLSGAGQKTKLVNQVVGALNLLATVEGLRLAKASGLDLPTTLSAVAAGAAGSWMWSNIGPKIAAGDFAPGFMVRLQQKDLRLAREFFEQLQLEAPGTALTADLFTKALAQGLGEQGNQALYRLWE